jgi:dTDP-4-dehydrorhamnose reductase
MLGSMVVDYLARNDSIEVSATTRPGPDAAEWPTRLPAVSWRQFAGAADVSVVDGHDWVINCIGVIKPFIKDSDAVQVAEAIRTNAALPHELARATEGSGTRVIQIATDCVYSGAKGNYVEDDPHDALDVYGKSKSLGEVPVPHFSHIRASIIGPEAGRQRSLLEWFLGQERDARLSGYVNHRWNGVTTLHFAKICEALIGGAPAPERLHLVPTGEVTKHALLEAFADAYGRSDVSIEPVDAPTVVDRTLATSDPGANAALWRAAGYETAPTVSEMVAELAQHEYAAGAVDSVG